MACRCGGSNANPIAPGSPIDAATVVDLVNFSFPANAPFVVMPVAGQPFLARSEGADSVQLAFCSLSNDILFPLHISHGGRAYTRTDGRSDDFVYFLLLAGTWGFSTTSNILVIGERLLAPNFWIRSFGIDDVSDTDDTDAAINNLPEGKLLGAVGVRYRADDATSPLFLSVVVAAMR